MAALTDGAGDPAFGCAEIWTPERDTHRQIALLSPDLIDDAMEFADKMRRNKTFTHFQHTMPDKMMGRDWKCWLLYECDIVIGWAQVQNFSMNQHKHHVARIGFALLEEWRGQGIGKQLVDFVINNTPQYKKLVASVYADNTAMITIYLKRGFVIEGFFENEEMWDGKPRNVLSMAFHRR